MDILNDILAKLPKPAAAPAKPAGGQPAAAGAAAAPAKPAAAAGAQGEEGQGGAATGPDGQPLEQQPGGKRLHSYSDDFQKAFGERPSE